MVGNDVEVAGRLRFNPGPETLEDGQAFALDLCANAEEDDAVRGAAFAIDEFAEVEVAGKENVR